MAVSSPTKLDPASVARLEGLELRARYIVDGFLTGQHRSPYRGQSVEFAEHREYAAGDDLRYVDWKVVGKTDRVYLKQFEAETSLSCYLAVDVSESMRYQGPDASLSKLEYAQCLAAALAYLVMRQRDNVGLATIDGGLREFVTASSNPANLDQLIHVLQLTEPSGKSDLGAALGGLADRLRRRSVVVVISDLLGKVESLTHGLRKLRHARHELVVLHTLDAAEVEFPFERATLFRGLESLPDVLAEPHGVRTAYLAAMARFLEQVHSSCRGSQADYELARTDEPLDAPLRKLLTARLRRRG
ncbi:MAG: DUF58 domain-containing protein [Pirellulales bacterium]|nr:DUF58 domain-containing protein [Pirellulales bacterium]